MMQVATTSGMTTMSNVSFHKAQKGDKFRHSGDDQVSLILYYIHYGTQRVGIIWKNSSEFVAWWSLTAQGFTVAGADYGTSKPTLQGCMNSAVQRIHKAVSGAVTLHAVSQRGDESKSGGKRRGFTPQELKLGFIEWTALIKSCRRHLSLDMRAWLADWTLWDLACSTMFDNERPLVRYGHYLGWCDRQNTERHRVESVLRALRDCYVKTKTEAEQTPLLAAVADVASALTGDTEFLYQPKTKVRGLLG